MAAPQLDMMFQISIAMLSATAFAFVAKWARQPVILAYIAAGVLVGSREGLGWVRTQDIEPISELGLILLLFMIGLEIDLKKLRGSGKTLLLSGVVQFVVCVVLGLLLAPWLLPASGARFDALYLAVACALSSSMIVVKLLYDKFELDTMPGRLTLGILIIQDIWAILFLSLQHTLTHPALVPLALSLVKAAFLVVASLATSRWILPLVFRSVSRLPELMLMAALAWCFGVSLLAAELELSRAMGALIAGISLSAFPYNLDVVAKIISLRDFFITLFFVSLGTQLPRPTANVVVIALGLTAFVIASRFISLAPLLYGLRTGNRISFITPLNLTQVSEFSLVICSIGFALGHVSDFLMSVIVTTLVIASVTSTYSILYSHEIFSLANPWFKRMGLRDLDAINAPMQLQPRKSSIVFLGFSRVASSVLEDIARRDESSLQRIFVIDFNPQVMRGLTERHIANIYGDVGSFDTLKHSPIHDASVLVCTLPDSILKGTTNLKLLRKITRIAPNARHIVTADFFYSARELYAAGASFVFIPRLMSSDDLARVVLQAEAGDIGHCRDEAVEMLAGRHEVLP